MKELKCLTCGTTDIKNFPKNERTSCTICGKDKRKASQKRSLIKHILNLRLTSAKFRALKTNMEFNIDLEYLKCLLKEQDNKCVYTNMEFNNEDGMLSLSMDRIDSTKGYVKGNIQFVLSCINYMKQEYSEENFIKMCKLVYLNNI